MGITFTKTIQIKSKWFAILFFSIFIVVGIILIAIFSARKNNANSKYYYVQGVVESCELETGSGGMNYIHSIAY